VGSTERSKFYPDLPTIAQTVPGYRAEGWWGVFAPGGTPKAVVERLNLAIRSVNEQPDIRKLLAQEGAEPGTYNPADFATYYFDEIAKWKKLVAERNLSSN
jgi:tripartite-type tricarboxylate transporter receptor subunit TctC